MTHYLDADHWSVHQLVRELTVSAEEARTLQFIKLLNPKLSKDGDQWCYILGEMPKDYVAGFGASPFLAAQDFVSNYLKTHP